MNRCCYQAESLKKRQTQELTSVTALDQHGLAVKLVMLFVELFNQILRDLMSSCI